MMYNGKTRVVDSEELRPVLGEILRTCVYPSIIRLRIERVHRQELKKLANGSYGSSGSEKAAQYAVKLYLTDGRLTMQALLQRNILKKPEILRIEAGAFLDIDCFKIKKAPRVNEQGHIVFLAIENCRVVRPKMLGQLLDDSFPSYRVERHEQNINGALCSDTRGQPSDLAGGFLLEDGKNEEEGASDPYSDGLAQVADRDISSVNESEDPAVNALEHIAGKVESVSEHESDQNDGDTTPKPTLRKGILSFNRTAASKRRRSLEEVSSDDDTFETASIDPATIKKRRMELAELEEEASLTTSSSSSWTLSSPSLSINHPSQYDNIKTPAVDAISADTRRGESLSRIQRSHPPGRNARTDDTNPYEQPKQETDLPLHNLASLLHPPSGQFLPRKNYMLNTFAVITYVGSFLISRPGSPFPPKRHIKIEDPSLHTKNFRGSAKAITVAVYRDAPNFKPTVGTVALFRGVVMQRLPNREIILNAYPPSKFQIGKFGLSNQTSRIESRAGPRDALVTSKPSKADDTISTDLKIRHRLSDNEWFVTAPELLTELGFDVAGMQEWWNRQRRQITR